MFDLRCELRGQSIVQYPCQTHHHPRKEYARAILVQLVEIVSELTTKSKPKDLER